MSGFIFVLIMDWVMRHTHNRKRGLRWKLTSVLEDLDYADDVALISSRLAVLQEKTDRLVNTAGVVGLKINPRKTKTLRMNHRCTLKLHKDRSRGGGRCGILRVPRFNFNVAKLDLNAPMSAVQCNDAEDDGSCDNDADDDDQELSDVLNVDDDHDDDDDEEEKEEEDEGDE
ncbi:acidic leucine-rich nuclear phosphoprotein 32 family member B-like [Montipora foliosa]|uniref:acidic leucine-rich nuclear phosphoprotein 32 family member B-like n=1 Tax=Montipora foliosa TaxID=591990 RepID=UPI0035F21102